MTEIINPDEREQRDEENTLGHAGGRCPLARPARYRGRKDISHRRSRADLISIARPRHQAASDHRREIPQRGWDRHADGTSRVRPD